MSDQDFGANAAHRVRLWFENTEGDYNYWLEQADSELTAASDSWHIGSPPPGKMAEVAAFTLGESMQHQMDEALELHEDPLSSLPVHNELLALALSYVDWQSVAEPFVEAALEAESG